MDVRTLLPSLLLLLLVTLPIWGQVHHSDSPADDASQLLLTGTVRDEAGNPPAQPTELSIECNGESHLQGYADAAGNFSLPLSRMSPFNFSAAATTMPSESGPAAPEGGLQLCSLQVEAAGYAVQRISLSSVAGESGPVNVGRIVIRPIESPESFTINAADANIPKQARKDFEGGRKAEKKGLWTAAAEKFERAVSLYPRFALAWVELGKVQAQQSDFVSAQTSFNRALQVNTKLVEAYLELAQLAAQQRNWQGLADNTDHLLTMNSAAIPQMWFLNAVANFNLRHFDRAETGALRARQLDTQHRVPRAEYLLGLILAVKHDYRGAAEHVRSYLQISPDAPEKIEAQEQLAKFDRLAAAPAISASTAAGK